MLKWPSKKRRKNNLDLRATRTSLRKRWSRNRGLKDEQALDSLKWWGKTHCGGERV
jgi:hypothetical protein